MRQAWFISDLHFDHPNILEFERETRPFASDILVGALEKRKPLSVELQSELKDTLKIHNEYIIDRINSFVLKHDTLWILGDIGFSNAESVKNVEKFKCQNKKLVLGNHDIHPMAVYVSAGFTKIHGMARHKEFVLTHAPIHPDQLDERYSANIHGHLHDYDIEDDRYINVNMDRNGCTPITLAQIRDLVRYRKTILDNLVKS